MMTGHILGTIRNIKYDNFLHELSNLRTTFDRLLLPKLTVTKWCGEVSSWESMNAVLTPL